MALNGGVSLAVWMGGCAVELDCARRARHSPEQVGEHAPTRQVYYELCQAFNRELVVDIMSGASAGGINGTLMAAAMVHKTRLHPDFVRGRWLDLGDFLELMHQPTDEPRSLMSGRRFARGLMAALTALEDPRSAVPGDRDRLWLPAGQEQAVKPFLPQLDVTVTDLRGVEREFLDSWGNPLVAREYRGRFRFREADDFSPLALAAAGRASASFPGAFEPFRPVASAWALTSSGPGDVAAPDPPWTIDGGLLDNAPIRAAIELVPRRAAHTQVSRHLLYVNAEPQEPLAGSSRGGNAPPGDPDGSNAPAPGESADAEAKAESPPELPEVLGYVLKLPRKAPFVDQLDAIERAVRDADFAGETVLPLLGIPCETLASVAAGLLPAYWQRRTLVSLDELLGDPAKASIALDALNVKEVSELTVPWVPRTMESSPTTKWRWGIRGSQRVCHVILDLIRKRLEGAPGGESGEPVPIRAPEQELLLKARVEIDYELKLLEKIYENSIRGPAVLGGVKALALPGSAEDTAVKLEGLATNFERPAREAFISVRIAIHVFAELVEDIEGSFMLLGAPELDPGLALLGEGWTTDEGFKAIRKASPAELSTLELSSPEQRFLKRVMSIEVIRRATSAEEPIHSAQRLQFAQLTPDAPTPILSDRPFTDPYPVGAERKLTGIRMGHFAGFLKRSWRANDFMWGRLDAATRVVDLLVEREPAHPGPAAKALAEALLPSDATELQMKLVHEAVADYVEGYAAASAGPPALDELRADLTTFLKGDLEKGGEKILTRVVCARAAQLEVLRHELPELVRASIQDQRDGSETPPLELGATAPGDLAELSGAGLSEAIDSVRDRGKPLPERLGRGAPAEMTSDLTARTAARAASVTLAGLRGAHLPGSRLLSFLRPLLLGLSGASAKSRMIRVGLVICFWAACAYLASRAIEASPREAPKLSDLLTPPGLVAIVAVIGALGALALPIARAVGAFRSSRGDALIRAAAMALLLIASVATPIVLAVWSGPLSLSEAFIAPEAEGSVPDLPLGALLVLTVGLAIVRMPFLARFSLDWVERRPPGLLSTVALSAVAGWVSAYTFPVLLDQLWFDSWQGFAAAVALVVPPLAAGGYFLFRAQTVRLARRV